MKKTLFTVLLLNSLSAFNQPEVIQQQPIPKPTLYGQTYGNQQGGFQQQQFGSPLQELPYIQIQEAIYPGNIIIQSGIALQEISQSLNTLQVLYYGIFPTDPNVRFFRKPADHLILIISYRLNNQQKYIGYEAHYDDLPNQSQKWSFQMVLQSQDRMQIYSTFKINTQQGSSFNAYRNLQQFLNSNKVYQKIVKAYQTNQISQLRQVTENNQYAQTYPVQVFNTVFEYIINTGINYQNLQVLNVSNQQDIFYYVFEMQVNRQSNYLGVKLRQNREIEILSVLIEKNLQDLLDYFALEVYDQRFIQFYNQVFFQSKNLPLWQQLQMSMLPQQNYNNQYNQQYPLQRPQQQPPTIFGQGTTFLLGSSAPEETIQSEEESEEKSD